MTSITLTPFEEFCEAYLRESPKSKIVEKERHYLGTGSPAQYPLPRRETTS